MGLFDFLNINITSKQSKDEVLSFLNKSFINHSNVFKGHIKNDRIKGYSKPPSIFIDACKSRVKGKVSNDGETTYIILNILPSWVLIVFTMLWSILVIIMSVQHYQSKPKLLSIDFLQFTAMMVIWFIIPIVMTLLKTAWDRHRIKRWFKKKLK